MSELYCTVHFHYSEENLPKYVTDFMEHEFMKARDVAVDAINPLLDVWNKDYTDPVLGEDDMKYNSYISIKENEVLGSINRLLDSPVKLWADEYGDIAGKFKVNGKTIIMHMTIKLLNEDRA